MQKILSLLTTAAFIAGSALPGIAQDYSGDTPNKARSSEQASPDWTGFYGGIQLGYGNIDTSNSDDNSGVIGGFTGGYDHDLGNWVIGASLDYDFADLDISGSSDSIDQIFRAKLRGGYKVGRGLIYATAGYANANSDDSGNDDGYFFGAGYDYLVSDSFSIGTELLYHDFNNFDSSSKDVEITTLQVRGTFRF